jgi:hypothetical protein
MIFALVIYRHCIILKSMSKVLTTGATVAVSRAISSTPKVSRRDTSVERHQSPSKVSFRERGQETAADRPSFGLDALPDQRSEAGRPPSLSSHYTGDRGAAVKLGNFTGTNMPLEVHLEKLANCSEYYGWSEVDRLSQLKGSLEDLLRRFCGRRTLRPKPSCCESCVIVSERKSRRRLSGTSYVSVAGSRRIAAGAVFRCLPFSCPCLSG